MQTSWMKVKFKDVVQFNPTVKLSKGDEFCFVPMEDVESLKSIFYTDKVKKYDGGSSSKFMDNDILFARITPCLQNRKITQIKIGKGDKGFGSTEFFVFRAKEKFLNQTFLNYYIRTNSFVESAINSMVGASGRQRADKGYISNLEILIPEVKTQNEIGQILLEYDNLIEINTKRITILEQMAEQLYKEWFVRMRFPNYENTKFVKGIPEGWELVTIKSFGKVVTGKTPSTTIQDYYDGDYPFIKTPDMHNFLFALETGETLSQRGFISQPSQKLPAGAICVSCIGSAGVVCITNKVSMTNQQIHSLVPKKSKQLEFLYYTLLKLKPTIELFGATGATMTNLSKGKFEKLLVVKPTDLLIENYHDATHSVFEEIKNLSLQNINLRKTRDLLLPRLISGKLKLETEITKVKIP